jgi:hypothetical protein
MSIKDRHRWAVCHPSRSCWSLNWSLMCPNLNLNQSQNPMCRSPNRCLNYLSHCL